MPPRVAMWKKADGVAGLTHNEVHVWRAAVDLNAATAESLEQLLSKDERVRAERFKFNSDAARFVGRRANLRILLGRYLSLRPESLRFVTNEYGKPALSPDHGVPDVRFNVSHSDGLALFAFVLGRQVGVDLERVREIPECLELAERFFDRREAGVLRKVSARQRSKAFLRSWTRREAFVKALGAGLSLPLDQLELDVELVDLDEGGGLNESSQAPWAVSTLHLGASFVGALVIEGTGWRTSCWQLPIPGE